MVNRTCQALVLFERKAHALELQAVLKKLFSLAEGCAKELRFKVSYPWLTYWPCTYCTTGGREWITCIMSLRTQPLRYDKIRDSLRYLDEERGLLDGIPQTAWELYLHE